MGSSLSQVPFKVRKIARHFFQKDPDSENYPSSPDFEKSKGSNVRSRLGRHAASGCAILIVK